MDKIPKFMIRYKNRIDLLYEKLDKYHEKGLISEYSETYEEIRSLREYLGSTVYSWLKENEGE